MVLDVGVSGFQRTVRKSRSGRSDCRVSVGVLSVCTVIVKVATGLEISEGQTTFLEPTHKAKHLHFANHSVKVPHILKLIQQPFRIEPIQQQLDISAKPFPRRGLYGIEDRKEASAYLGVHGGLDWRGGLQCSEESPRGQRGGRVFAVCIVSETKRKRW